MRTTVEGSGDFYLIINVLLGQCDQLGQWKKHSTIEINFMEKSSEFTNIEHTVMKLTMSKVSLLAIMVWFFLLIHTVTFMDFTVSQAEICICCGT